ncbi:helix-turn-helix domain-containing protein [Candidatus Omnitrophota bacterium]
MEKLLTIKQLSELLEVSPRTLYEWTHAGFIPHYKFPNGVRFKLSEIEKWLQRRRRKGRSTYKLCVEDVLD